MPPKPAITADAVTACAFDLVRREGIEALSARRIADALGCSTQPVYSACGSMGAIREAVEGRAESFIEEHLRAGPGGEPALLQLGLATLRLARDEPHLFQLASHFMRKRLKHPPRGLLAAMRADPMLAGVDEPRMIELHAALWVFTQGLATLIGAESHAMSFDRAAEMLRYFGRALVTFESAQ